ACGPVWVSRRFSFYPSFCGVCAFPGAERAFSVSANMLGMPETTLPIQDAPQTQPENVSDSLFYAVLGATPLIHTLEVSTQTGKTRDRSDYL
ncbi:MAG: hypothetical protein ABI557_10750, partial [Aureliella sp.]